jgi:hypothetical protein
LTICSQNHKCANQKALEELSVGKWCLGSESGVRREGKDRFFFQPLFLAAELFWIIKSRILCVQAGLEGRKSSAENQSFKLSVSIFSHKGEAAPPFLSHKFALSPSTAQQTNVMSDPDPEAPQPTRQGSAGYSAGTNQGTTEEMKEKIDTTTFSMGNNPMASNLADRAASGRPSPAPPNVPPPPSFRALHSSSGTIPSSTLHPTFYSLRSALPLPPAPCTRPLLLFIVTPPPLAPPSPPPPSTTTRLLPRGWC